MFFSPRFIVAIVSDSTFTSGLATKESFFLHSYFYTIFSLNINGCDNCNIIVIIELYNNMK